MDKMFYLCHIFRGEYKNNYETAKDNKIYNKQGKCISR